MNIIAFIISLAAIFCFLLAAYGVSRTNPPARAWHFGWLGLALLTVAWMVQLIFASGGHITVH